MPRSYSDNLLDSLTSEETSEVYTTLVTVKDNEGTVLARFTDDSVDTTYAGSNFVAYPFSISLPDNQEGRETTAQLTLTNVDRQLIEAVRASTGFLYATLRVVLASDTSIVMVYYPDMEMRRLTYNTDILSGELTYESFLNEPYPKDLMVARHFPGLFIA
jgi:hypothetical protein